MHEVCKSRENSFARIESNCTSSDSFSYLMNRIPHIKQSSLFRHFFRTEKSFVTDETKQIVGGKISLKV